MDTNTLAITNIINEHHLANGDDFVGVPVKSFEQRGLEYHDVRIALSILAKNGVVKEYHRCWGHTVIEKGIARYEEVALTKPKTTSQNDVESYEVFHITLEPRILKQFIGQPKTAGKIKKSGLIEQYLIKQKI